MPTSSCSAVRVPTVWLQERIYEIGQLPWYDVFSWAVYLTHYFMVFIAAAYLWRVSHLRFLEFRAMVLTLSIAAFVTYALVPAAPPWMAADRLHDRPRRPGHRQRLDRARGLAGGGDLGQGQLALQPGRGAAVAARRVPDAALPFFWRSGRFIRVLGVGYVLAMAWTLVYGGEHYVFDVLLGWIYAVAVFFGVRWVRAKLGGRRSRARGADRRRRSRHRRRWARRAAETGDPVRVRSP